MTLYVATRNFTHQRAPHLRGWDVTEGDIFDIATADLAEWSKEIDAGSIQVYGSEATDVELAAHSADTTSVHGIADTSTLYRAGGTDVAIADGGTGASTAAAARTNLGAARASTAVDVRDHGAVGDGVTDDTAAIQAALAASDVVKLPAGLSFLVGTTTSVIINADDKALIAEPGATLVITADRPAIRIENCARAIVDGINITGSAGTAKTSQRGIQATNMDDSLITGCTVTDVEYDGILLLSGCDRNRIIGNLVIGAGDDGINIGGDAATACIGNVVIGNTVRDGKTSTGDGIHISNGSEHTTVIGNTVRGCGASISVFGTDYALISGNICDTSSTGLGFIVATASTNVRVTGNTFRGMTIGVSITLSCVGLEVRDNLFEACTTDAIVISLTALTVQNSVIANNRIVGGCTTAGIRLSHIDGVAVTGNQIIGVTGDGIQLASATPPIRCRIEGNRITTPGSRGIYLNDSATCVSLAVVGNQVLNPVGRGIEVRPGAPFIVDGNVIVDSGDYGMVISAFSGLRSGLGCSVSRNHVTGTATAAGITINNYDDIIVADNFVDVTSPSIAQLYVNVGSRVIERNNRCDGTITAASALRGVSALSVAATTLGTVTGKVAVQDHLGAVVGYLPVYGSIT